MLGHDDWATSQRLARCTSLSEADLNRELDIGHRTPRETLDDRIYVIDFWTGWMTDRPVEHDRSTQPYDRSLDALVDRYERFQPAFADLARGLRDAQRLDETFIDHYGVRQSLGATILQLVHHNAQHRGEVRHMLERLGVAELWDFDPQEWEHATGRV
jgi:uncharacterized damage-inducible protein DinB